MQNKRVAANEYGGLNNILQISLRVRNLITNPNFILDVAL